MTHRQYVGWLAWLDLQWDTPNRTDHYLMALRAEVRRGWIRDPASVDDNAMRLVFNRTEALQVPSNVSVEEDGLEPPLSVISPRSREQAERESMSMSKARWLSSIGKGKPIQEIRRGE